MTNQLQKMIYGSDFIAYKQVINTNNILPTIIFCHGFQSDMEGSKAVFLHDYCLTNGLNFIRFDYFGHGSSSGEFAGGTISKWLSNVLQVIDNIATDSVILVGSSMGGWLSLLSAIARPQKVVGLVGIASAPDFTEELIWQAMNQDPTKQLITKGMINFSKKNGSSFLNITKDLIEDGRKHLLLSAKINIDIPVILLHGIKDINVPFDYALRTAKKLISQQVTVVLVKASDHHMSLPSDLELIAQSLQTILALCAA